MPTEITSRNIELHVVGLKKVWHEFNPDMTNWHSQIAPMSMSTKEAYLKFVQAGDFPIPSIVGENQDIPDVSRQWPFPQTVTPVKIAQGWSVSDEAWEEDQYGEMDDTIDVLKLSFNKAREKLSADRFNNATSSSSTYANPDGLPLASSAHKLFGGQTTSNLMTDAFGPNALEKMRSNLLVQVSHRGDPDPDDGPYDLMIHPSLASYADRVVYSGGQAGTDVNDNNVIGKSIRRIIRSPYFTNPLAWGLRGGKDNRQPFGCLERRSARLTLDHDKSKEKMRYRISEMYVYFEKGWRMFFYSTGAG